MGRRIPLPFAPTPIRRGTARPIGRPLLKKAETALLGKEKPPITPAPEQTPSTPEEIAEAKRKAIIAASVARGRQSQLGTQTSGRRQIVGL